MKLILFAGLAAAALWGQSSRPAEPLTRWRYFREIALPQNAAGLRELLLDREALEVAREDLADLRLYDAARREIPYAARVLRDVNIQEAQDCREFNRSADGMTASMSCDAGEAEREHNEIEVASTGINFRRMVEIQGGNDGTQWTTLASQAALFRFSSNGQTVEQAWLPYPVSRFRYVRVMVHADPQTDRAAPEITGLRVRRAVRVRGEAFPYPATMETREADKVNGRAASIWRMELGGEVPVDRLTVTAGLAPFARPFEVRFRDEAGVAERVASGELRMTPERREPEIRIDFAEHRGRRLELAIIDDRNEPLDVTKVVASGAARQVLFELGADARGPLRMYYGNPLAAAPHYDVAARLPAGTTAKGPRLALGGQTTNPDFEPEPMPFSERTPWLVYVILTIGCAALAGILVNLARAARRLETAV